MVMGLWIDIFLSLNIYIFMYVCIYLPIQAIFFNFVEPFLDRGNHGITMLV